MTPRVRRGRVAVPGRVVAPDGERERQEALRRYAVLDTAPEPEFDALTRLAAHLCATPIALITLLDGDRQWFKSHRGIAISETPREHAFCDHALAAGELLVVPDTRADPRFRANPLVTGEPHVRFYAGAPLVTPEGHGLGTLCVVDRRARTLSPEQGEALRLLARQTVAQLELRRRLREVTALQAAREAEAERSARNQAALTELARLPKTDRDAALREITRVAARTLGVARVGAWLFEPDGQEAVCAALYRLDDDAHESGARLRAADLPVYFRALHGSRTIAAADARTDPRTRELAAWYLEPRGIGALLDVPVWRAGRVVGVLCHEHVGGPRAWNHEEEEMAASAADMVAVALEASERERSEGEARRTAGRMRAVAAAAAAVLRAGSPARLRDVLHDACQTVIPFHTFTFATYDAGTDTLRAWDGRPAAADRDPAPVPAAGHPLEAAVRARRSLLADDAGVPAILAPVAGGDGVLGVLAVRRGAPGAYAAEDVEVLDALASLAGNALGAMRAAAEERRARDALLASEESYRSIFDLSSDAIFVHDPESGAVLDANRKACELHGCTLDELRAGGVGAISEGGAAFSAAEARARVRAAAAGRPQRFEWRVRDAAGAPLWVEVSLHGVEIRGEPRVLASVRNIAERKAAEEALQRANDALEQRVEERTSELAQTNLALEEEIADRTRAEEELREKTSELEAVFRALPDLYFRVGADGTLLDHEAGSHDPVFVPCPGCVGLHVRHVFPPELVAAFDEGCAEIARTGVLACIEGVLAQGERERHFEARLLPFADGQVITVVRDITDRAEAERSLQRREEHFRTLIEGSSDVATILDVHGTNLYQSPSVERVFGYTAGEMVGTSAFDRIHPDDAARAREVLAGIVATPGASVAVELRYRHADGSWRWIEALGRTLRPDTAEAGLIINVRDVTDRRRAEEALRRSEQRFRSVVENTSDLVTLMDADGTIRYESPSVQRLFGYGVDELIGTSGFALVHPDDLAETLEQFRQVVENPGQPRGASFRLRHADGSWRFVEAVASTLSPATADEGVVVNSRDITERRRAELELRRTTRFLENLIASSPGVIFRGSGTSFQTTYISPNAEAVLGFPAERFLAEPHLWVERTHPDDRDRVAARIVGSMESGAADLTYEYRFRHRDGRYRDLLARARFERDASGTVEVLGYTLDVSPLKAAEAALRAAKEEAEAAREVAEEASRAKSEFLSRMSHELRTPMNSILGFAQLLARRAPTPEQQRSVDQILRAGGHLLNLINEVLDIARIEAKRQPLSLEPVRVDAVVAEAVSLIRPLAAEFGCGVGEPDPAPGLFVRADRQRVTQVLLNLLSNAVKYNRPGGSVRVEVHADGDTARIAVHDTGSGIAPEAMDQLFVPFARLGAERSGVEGTGLGLALSQRLAEAMGGALTARSTVGVGSTFSLELPVVADPLDAVAPPPPPDPARAEAHPPGRSATLLYIEDNLANLTLIERLLASRREITLRTAMQGRMGMYLAWEHTPDLVLLDLHLPDLAGDEVLRRLRADPRTARTPVVVISADATPGRMERLRAAGADAYLTKPLDLDEFLGTIDRLLAEERP